MRQKYEEILHSLEDSRGRLLAVSKGQPIEKIKTLYDLGQRDFGENYAAEMVEKMEGLAASCPEIRWHYIGKIQKRQAKFIARASWVHSVGSDKEAAYLNRHVQAETPVNVLLQVNIADEPQKGGYSVEALREKDSAPCEQDGLIVQGLMCLPPVDHESKNNGRYFAKTRELRDELVTKWGQPLPELSMGMSSDYLKALSEGATWVRIGTFLFGPRPVKPKKE